MNRAAVFYRIDTYVQGIFIVPMLLCYLLGFFVPAFFVFGAMLQFFLGAAQLLSGLIHSIKYHDPKRRKYVKFAISYLASLFIGGMLLEHLEIDASFLFIIFLIIIPAIIAIWYFNLTYEDYKAAPNSIKKREYQEDLLDDMTI